MQLIQINLRKNTMKEAQLFLDLERHDKWLSREEALCDSGRIFVVFRNVAPERNQFLRCISKGRVESTPLAALALPFTCVILATRFARYWHEHGGENVVVGSMLSGLNAIAMGRPHAPHSPKSHSILVVWDQSRSRRLQP